MTSFLDGLGISGGTSKGTDIYVVVSASNIMEMAIPDDNIGVKTYVQTYLEYNDSLREISSLDKFKSALEELFRIANIKPNGMNIHLTLPTVWFGYKDNIPLLLDDAAINNVILGDLEQTYIFKRKDPVPYWFDAVASTNSDSRSVFYTAIQADVKSDLQAIFKEIGANLVSLECSVLANMRGLYTSGFTVAQMDDPGFSWSLMIINNSGYQMFGIQGKKFLEYYEEPLAIKSYEGDEIYSVINDAVQVALMSTPSNALVVLSQTDYVSAEILSKHLQFSGSTIPVEDNKFKKEPLIDLSQALIPEDQIKVSLQMIGALTDSAILPVNIDFLSTEGERNVVSDIIEIPLGNGKILELTPLKAIILSSILLVLLVAPISLLWITMHLMESSTSKQIKQLDTQIKEMDSQLDKYNSHPTTNEFDSVKEIENVLKNNRTKIMAYTSLGESIPQNLYLTYFMTGDSGLVNIQGCANSVEDVYIFFKNLKDSLFESKLRLSKLDLKSGSLDSVINSSDSPLDNAPYVFEITNMDDGQLSGFTQALTKNSDGSKKSAEGNSDNPNSTTPSAGSSSPAQTPSSSAPPLKPPVLPGSSVGASQQE